MARGNSERKTGRQRHRQAVIDHAGSLALCRQQLDGMHGDDPDFDSILSTAITAATDLEGRAKRMSRGGLSRRAACEIIVTTSVTLANERNSHMSHNTAPQFTSAPEGAAAGETSHRHLRLVSDLGAVALVPMDEQHPFYEDWDRHTADMPMQGV